MNEQEIKSFSEKEHQTWTALFESLERNRKEQAHSDFSHGVKELKLNASEIPSLDLVNELLKDKTGWAGVPVEGLEDGLSFFKGLSEKKFPIGNFIRDAKVLSYTPAPDIFHDLYGHMPFFADQEYADFCCEFGKMALQYKDSPEKLRMFERLFWFGVEFPLIETKEGRRIFGGGLLSSAGESDYALSDEPEVRRFDLKEISMREYRIDEFQKTLYVIENKEQLFGCLPEFQKIVDAYSGDGIEKATA